MTTEAPQAELPLPSTRNGLLLKLLFYGLAFLVV